MENENTIPYGEEHKSEYIYNEKDYSQEILLQKSLLSNVEEVSAQTDSSIEEDKTADIDTMEETLQDSETELQDDDLMPVVDVRYFTGRVKPNRKMQSEIEDEADRITIGRKPSNRPSRNSRTRESFASEEDYKRYMQKMIEKDAAKRPTQEDLSTDYGMSAIESLRKSHEEEKAKKKTIKLPDGIEIHEQIDVRFNHETLLDVLKNAMNEMFLPEGLEVDMIHLQSFPQEDDKGRIMEDKVSLQAKMKRIRGANIL